jgi:Domain of unknown function (DUF4410)
MKALPSVLAAALVFSAVVAISSRAIARRSAPSQSPSGDSFPNKSVTIYVADFDIDVLRATEKHSTLANVPPAPTGGTTAAPPASASATPPNASGTSAAPNTADARKPDAAKPDGLQPDSQPSDPQRTEAKDDSPAAQAARLVNLTATNLVKALEQAGYTARRLRGGARPDSGIIIRGVFAQADANAGLRRIVVGGDSTDSKMVLFVGVGNLARPDQVVYLPVGPTSADGRLGPVINVSVYAPISRFDLEKNPSEDSLKRLAPQIVNEVTTLLNANRLAVSE